MKKENYGRGFYGFHLIQPLQGSYYFIFDTKAESVKFLNLLIADRPYKLKNKNNGVKHSTVGILTSSGIFVRHHSKNIKYFLKAKNIKNLDEVKFPLQTFSTIQKLSSFAQKNTPRKREKKIRVRLEDKSSKRVKLNNKRVKRGRRPRL